jgi:hypothetical protein
LVIQRQAFNRGMVYATKENYDDIQRVVELTSLTRAQIVRAMSNERRRFTELELNTIMETGRLSTQLKDIRKQVNTRVVTTRLARDEDRHSIWNQ